MAGERERISREIHDTLAQGFTSVVTLARATELALDRGDLAAVRERLQLIEQTAADNLSEARLIVAEMTPGHLQSRTLSEALQRLVDAVSAESGMTGTLRVEGEPVVLPANSEVVLLRTAQEGLSNVRRHSGATTFEVALSYEPDGPVALAVSDNGVGFAPGAEARGYGLDGATARAAEVGGRFDVDSAPGAGLQAEGGGAPMTLRLLVVDDHPVVRMGLVAMLSEHADFEVVGEAADGAEAVLLAARLHPGRRADGPADAGDGRRRRRRPRCWPARPRRPCWCSPPTTPTPTSSGPSRPGPTATCSRTPPERRWPTRSVARLAARRCSPLRSWRGWPSRLRAPATPTLTDREAQVLQCVAKGMSNAEVGRELHIGEATVKTPPAAGLREARGDRPHGGRHRGIQERARSSSERSRPPPGHGSQLAPVSVRFVRAHLR